VGPLKRPVPVGWKRSGKQTTEIHTKIKTRGVSQCGLAIDIKKYQKAKEELCKLKNMIFKKSSKKDQNPSRYYNSITNLKFQHKPKYHLSKSLL
jgi:hypothetical protein